MSPLFLQLSLLGVRLLWLFVESYILQLVDQLFICPEMLLLEMWVTENYDCNLQDTCYWMRYDKCWGWLGMGVYRGKKWGMKCSIAGCFAFMSSEFIGTSWMQRACYKLCKYIQESFICCPGVELMEIKEAQREVLLLMEHITWKCLAPNSAGDWSSVEKCSSQVN